MSKQIKRDSTNFSWRVTFLDADGALVTGKTHSDITSMGWRRYIGGQEVTEVTSRTPASIASKATAHTDDGFIEDADDTGTYRYDIADTAIATGSDSADNVEPILACSGVSSIVFERLQLVDFDPIADGAAIKAKTDQFVFTVANQVDANALSGGGGLDAAGIRSAVGLASANLDTQLGDIPTVSEFNARTLLASAYFDASADTVNLAADQSGVTIGTVNALTGHTVQTGDSYARLGAPAGASVSADIAAIEAGTAPTAAQVADAVWTEAIADHSGTVGSTAESLSNASAPTAGAVADAVWDEAMSGHVSVGSFGYWFSGITRLASWLGIIAGKTADASTLTEVNATTAGASFNNTTDSQEAIRDRGDAAWLTGSVTGDAIITPLSASEITRVNGTDIAYFIGETIATTIAITDSSGAALDVSAKTLQIVIDRGRSGHTDVQVISSGSISVGGASNNQVTFTNSAAVTATAGVLRWALRDTADGDRVLARGNIRVLEAADQDA